MEDQGAEFLINSETIDEKHIITLQTAVRGSLVRKWMKEVRESFRDVVIEIEKNSSMCVEWDKQLPCLPKVYRKRHCKVRKTEQDVKHKSSVVGKSKKSEDTSTTIGSNKLDKDIDTSASKDLPDLFVNSENKKLGLRSAETQTSFIEICKTSPADWAEKDHTSNIFLESYTDQTNIDKVRNSEEVIHDLLEDYPDKLSVKSDDKLLYEKEMSPSSETWLNLQSDSGSQGTIMIEPIDELAGVSDQQNNTKPYKRADEQHDFVTQVEDFELPDSDGSRHSSISVTSNKSAKCSKVQNESKKESGRVSVQESDIESHDLHKDETGFDSDRSMTSQKLRKYNDIRSFEDVGEWAQNELLDSAHSQDSRKSGNSCTSQKSSRDKKKQEKSVERVTSPPSDRSDTSQKSQRSATSKKSSYSQQSDTSRKSDRSLKNNGIKERRSRTAHSTHDRECDIMSPRPSSISPVPLSRRQEEKITQSYPGSSNQDSTILTTVTSVWDSLNSFIESCDYNTASNLPDDLDELRELRKNISMELLWVQQAIISRKNYLKLKNKM